jgi:hypothetical protein
MKHGAPTVVRRQNSNRNFTAPAAKIPKPTWEERFPSFQEKKMKKMLLRFGLPSILLLALAVVAIAASPHFINASAQRSGNQLIVSFKEAGVGDSQNIDYVASANATATYQCVNGGGTVPSDPKKTTVQGPVSAEGTFASGKNGSVTGTLTLNPPTAAPFCPNGQTETLLAGSVSYTNVTITDTTNGVSKSIPGTF